MADSLHLYLAVKEGNLVEVQKLLRWGHDIGKMNPETGLNSLHLAVLTGNYDIVELLSRNEAYINSTCTQLPRGGGCEGYTPLHFSVDLCYKDITKLLLSRKANVNEQDVWGNTALHVAGRNGLILNESYSYYGNVYFEYFGIRHFIKKLPTTNEYCDIIDILLRAGANARLINNFNETVLHLACELNNDSIARIILKECSSIVNYKDKLACTALHFATSSYNNVELVKLLIEYGADIDATDYLGSTPLCYAFMEGKFDVVQILVKNGCNVNVKGFCKPIYSAISDCNLEVLKLLLEHGADTSRLDAISFLNFSICKELDYEKYLFESFCKVFFKTKMNIFEDYENSVYVRSTTSVSRFEVFILLLQYGCFKNIDREREYCGRTRTLPTHFVMYVIKLKMLGSSFARNYPDIHAPNFNLQPYEKIYEENCKKEVEILRRIFICCNISLLDFLNRDLNKMVRLLKNQEIVNTLESLNYNNLFIYRDLIKTFVKLGMERRSKLNRCYECFNVIFCHFPKLPDMVVEAIFDFFTTDDLKLFLTT